MHGFEPRIHLTNEWNIDNFKVSEKIEQERLDSNSRTIEEQNKVLKRSNKLERLSRLRTGDLVMKEIKSVSLEKRKHLTPRFKGPYLIIKILDMECVIQYCFKNRKDIIHLKKYFGKKPKGYLNVKTRYGIDSE